MLFRMMSVIALLAGPAILTAPSGSQDLFEEAMRGIDLNTAQAEGVERQLAQNPQDLKLRAQLLGFYSRHPDAAPARQTEHVLWFIRNAPEADLLEGPEGEILPMYNPEGYEEGKEAWLRQIGKEPTNAVFLKHATSFLSFADPALSSELLKRGEELDPSNPYWAEQLGRQRWLDALNPREGRDPAKAALALKDFERAYELSGARGRAYLLPKLGMAAFVVGEVDKARTFAEAMLEGVRDDWNEEDRIHYGNLILGRIALSDGDLGEAGRRLVAAARTPGSPVLMSFGPDMALAEALLKRGETQSVLHYLELCLDFWEMGQDRLKNWIALIEAGRTPDFSRHYRF